MFIKFLGLLFFIERNARASWEARTMTCDSGRPLKCRIANKAGHVLDSGCRLEDVPLDQQRLTLQSESDDAKIFTTTSTLLAEQQQGSSLTTTANPKRLACALDVRGAVKSSASIKMPLKAVQCVRYYTYNDYLDENEERVVDPSSGKVLKPDWYMWIKEPCQNVSVTIWYFFPEEE